MYSFLRPRRLIARVEAEAGPEVGQPLFSSLLRERILNYDIPVFQKVGNIFRYRDIKRQLIDLQERILTGKILVRRCHGVRVEDKVGDRRSNEQVG